MCIKVCPLASSLLYNEVQAILSVRMCGEEVLGDEGPLGGGPESLADSHHLMSDTEVTSSFLLNTAMRYPSSYDLE